jgi:hypothetical protein
MVPEEHELIVPSHPQLKVFYSTEEFETEVRTKLQAQYEVNLIIRDQDPSEKDAGEDHFILAYTRNNAGGLKDAIEFLVSRLVPHGLDAATVKGAIPRPKSDTFEETLPFFDSKLLQRTHPSNGVGATDSPTRSTFAADDVSERGSIFDKLRKPGSISSLSSFLERRKNHSNSSTSLFKHASSNASKASLVSMESRDSGYRNPWNDSGINIATGTEDDSTYGSNGWPTRFDFKSFNTALPGDSTPKHGTSLNNASGNGFGGHEQRPSFDSNVIGTSNGGRPATSHSFSSVNGYPGPIGPPR